MEVAVRVYCLETDPVQADWYPARNLDGCAVVCFQGQQIYADSLKHLDALAAVLAEARAWLATRPAHAGLG